MTAGKETEITRARESQLAAERHFGSIIVLTRRSRRRTGQMRCDSATVHPGKRSFHRGWWGGEVVPMQEKSLKYPGPPGGVGKWCK